MTRIKLTGLLVLLVLQVQFVWCNEGLMKLVQEFLQAQGSVKLTAFLCFEKKILVEFWAKQKIPTTILTGLKYLSHLHPEQEQFFVVDLSCNNSKTILDKAQELNLFQAPFRWMLLNQDESLEPIYFGIDSRVFIVRKNANHSTYTISTIYKYSTKSELIENYISSWSKLQGLAKINQFSAPRNRTNLMGITIGVSYVFVDPSSPNHISDYREKEKDGVSKMHYLLVNHLGSFVNATIKRFFQRTWGYKNETSGCYSGMFGDLQAGRAEIAATPAFITKDRLNIADFFAATQTKMKFIFKAPPLSYATNVYTLPFNSDVWFTSFIIIPVILLVLYLIVLWEWKHPIFTKKIRDKFKSSKPTIVDVFMMEIGAITQQGSDAEPSTSSGRIATIFTFVALMFLYTAYSANIVALLQSTTNSIQSVSDLLHSRIKLGVEDIAYAHHYFENEPEPLRKTIYRTKIAPPGQKPNFMTAEEGVRKMRDEFFAFHIELDKAYKLVSRTFRESEKCGFNEIDFANFLLPLISSRKNSSYKELFKMGYRRIEESGIQNCEFRRIYTTKPACSNQGSNFISVGLIDCYAAFLIFGIGVVISLMVFILEWVWIKYQRRA